MSTGISNHADSPGLSDDQCWVVVEDQHGTIAWRWRSFDGNGNGQVHAQRAAVKMNRRAEAMGIRTRYRAVPRSMIVVFHQLSVYHREGTAIDWRPAELLPEDYYLQA